MFWLRQLSSEAQDGDVESSPSKSLSEIPPAAMYFCARTQTFRTLLFWFYFLQYDEIGQTCEKKKKNNKKTPKIH